MTIENEGWQMTYDDQGEPVQIGRGKHCYAVVPAADVAALWHHATKALRRSTSHEVGRMHRILRSYRQRRHTRTTAIRTHDE